MNGITRSYGWQPSLPDFRDQLFAYKASPEAIVKKPAKHSILTQTKLPILAQGSLGSCGPHSLSSKVYWCMLNDSIPGEAFMSRLFSYYTARQVMGTIPFDSGVSNRAMLQAFKKYGYCDESLWPYQPSRFKERPPQECWNQASNRVDAIVYRTVPQTLDDMRACLFEMNRPILFGFSVFSSLETEEVDRTGNIPMPSRFDRQVGGHDVILTGYDDEAKRFTLQNSWGPGWGNHGLGTIPYDYATNPRLSGDFWVIEKATHDVAPTPPAPTPPTTDLISQLIKAVEAGDWISVLRILAQMIFQNQRSLTMEKKAQLNALASELEAAIPPQARQEGNLQAGGLLSVILNLVAALRSGDARTIMVAVRDLLNYMIGEEQALTQSLALGVDWRRVVEILIKVLPIILAA